MSVRIAILLSGRHGRGSNMQAIAAACASGQINGTVTAVIGSAAESPALARAREIGLPTQVVRLPTPVAGYGGKTSRIGEEFYSDSLRLALDTARADLVCLAGYMRIVPDTVVSQYAGRLMNIHAALLPAFGGKGMYGMHIHEAVLGHGAKVSGCTVHFVDEQYDTGPIICQSAVPVEEDDTPETLAARVLAAEHETYPRAVALFAAGRLMVEGRRVHIKAPA